MFFQGGGHPLYDSVTSVSGHQPCGGIYQAMSLLACAVWVPLSCSQKLPAALPCPRCPTCLYQAPQRWLREECRGDARSHVCCSVLTNGFSNNQYRSLRMESCLCSFEICRVRISCRVGRRKMGHGFHVCGFLCLVTVVCGMLSYCNPRPGSGLNLIVYWLSRLSGLLCSSGLPSGCCILTLYGHEHQTVSVGPVSFLLLFHLLCSPQLPTFRCLNVSKDVHIFIYIYIRYILFSHIYFSIYYNISSVFVC